MGRFFTALAAAGLCFAGQGATHAGAAEIVDQEQLETTDRPLAIGGGSEQELAQSFTVGVDGVMTQIRAPIGCASGDLIVEIVAVDENGDPGERVLASGRAAAAEFLDPAHDFHTVYLSPPLPVSAGDRYAIIFRNPTGVCTILSGPEGDSYPGGQYYYDARPNPPGWVGGKDRPAPMGTPGDLPFQTVLEDGAPGGPRSNLCVANVGGRFVPLPINDQLPICRCLEDPVLNEWRCRIMHPDFFLVRRAPLPGPAAPDLVTEEWAFTPLTQLSAPVRISLPGGPNGALVHEFGKKSKPGSFEYFAVNRDLKAALFEPGLATFSYAPSSYAGSAFGKEFALDPRYSAKPGK